MQGPETISDAEALFAVIYNQWNFSIDRLKGVIGIVVFSIFDFVVTITSFFGTKLQMLMASFNNLGIPLNPI
jgi:hypothetical protein